MDHTLCRECELELHDELEFLVEMCEDCIVDALDDSAPCDVPTWDDHTAIR